MRTVAAFLIAPLALAALLLFFPAFHVLDAARGEWRIAIPTVAIISYTVVLVTVMPIFLILGALGYTKFWVAPAQGAATGVLLWLIVTSFKVPGHDLYAIAGTLGRFVMAYPMRLVLIVLTGAAEVTLVWLIARPDGYISKRRRRAKDAADIKAF